MLLVVVSLLRCTAWIVQVADGENKKMPSGKGRRRLEPLKKCSREVPTVPKPESDAGDRKKIEKFCKYLLTSIRYFVIL